MTRNPPPKKKKLRPPLHCTKSKRVAASCARNHPPFIVFANVCPAMRVRTYDVFFLRIERISFYEIAPMILLISAEESAARALA